MDRQHFEERDDRLQIHEDERSAATAVRFAMENR